MRFLFKRILLVIPCFLIILSFSSCQEQVRESSAPNATETTPAPSETGAHPIAPTGDEPAPAFSVPAFSFAGKGDRTIYLDREGALIPSLSDGAKIITDCVSGEPLYYTKRSRGITTLYNLAGEELDSSESAYGSGFGPYVIRGKGAGLGFSMGIITDGDLIDPVGGTCLLEGVTNLYPLGEGKALVLRPGSEPAYLLDQRGQVSEWPGEADLFLMPLVNISRKDLLICGRSEGGYLFYDTECKLLKSVKAYEGEVIFPQGKSPDLCILIRKGRNLEIWDYRRNISYSLDENAPLWESMGTEEYHALQSNGRLIWTPDRLYDIKGKLLYQFDRITYRSSPEMPFLASRGGKVFVLDEEGRILREKEIPNLQELADYNLPEDAAMVPLLLRGERGTREEYNWSILLLNAELEPLSQRRFHSVWEAAPGILTLEYIEGGAVMKTLLMDRQGRILIEDIRGVGYPLGGAPEGLMAVAKGPYIGLIDREGRWVRKNSIYDIPLSYFYED